jgi:hypothetical protein
MSKEALDKFGEFLIRRVRDESISDWKMILDGTMKGSHAEMIRQRLSSLSPASIAAVKAVIPGVIDTVLHHLLWGLEEDKAIDIHVDLADGTRIADLSQKSDGFPGELYTADGWIRRFSEAGGWLGEDV